MSVKRIQAQTIEGKRLFIGCVMGKVIVFQVPTIQRGLIGVVSQLNTNCMTD